MKPTKIIISSHKSIKMFNRLFVSLVIAATSIASGNAATPPSFQPASINVDAGISLLTQANFMNMDFMMPIDECADEDNNNDALISDLLAEASGYMGTRYMRGGKSPRGFDCSGFTGYIFKQFGYRLSASSRAQFSDGVEVDRNSVRPGDLLFFKGSRSGGIGHVGIAVDADPGTGDITFIHAAIKGGIRIDRISAPYYSSRYVGARRVIL